MNKIILKENVLNSFKENNNERIQYPYKYKSANAYYL